MTEFLSSSGYSDWGRDEGQIKDSGEHPLTATLNSLVTFVHYEKLEDRFKLAQEPDIIFWVEPEVVDPILQLCHPFNPHPKRKASVDFRVDATVL